MEKRVKDNENEKKLEELNDWQKKLYKVSNIFRKELIVLLILVLILAGGIVILDLTSSGMWQGLGTVLATIALLFLSVPIILFYFGLKNCKKYVFSNNEKALIKIKVFNILSLVVDTLYIMFLFYDELGLQEVGLGLIIGFILFLIFPSIIILLLCFNLNVKKWLVGIILFFTVPFIVFRLSIMSPNKIAVDVSKLPTGVDFVAELRERNLLSSSYDLIGNNYLNVEKFQETDWYNGFSNIETLEENNKYSMYQYTDYENSINGMTIEWIIYSVNNKIYAYLEYISSDYTSEITEVAEEYNISRKIVVSEEEKLTTYNVKGKYYSYGGGIMTEPKLGDTMKLVFFGNHITEIDSTRLYMLDRYNSDCADIVVVDEINDTTLTDIAYKIVSGYGY